MACTWFGAICSRCCLTVLLGPAWVLLSKIYNPFPGSLYIHGDHSACSKPPVDTYLKVAF